MLLKVVTSLLLAAAPETGTNAATPAKPEDRKICRKQVETGSHIKGKKLCYTAKQWQMIADANREEVERNLSMGSKSGQ